MVASLPPLTLVGKKGQQPADLKPWLLVHRLHPKQNLDQGHLCLTAEPEGWLRVPQVNSPKNSVINRVNNSRKEDKLNEILNSA